MSILKMIYCYFFKHFHNFGNSISICISIEKFINHDLHWKSNQYLTVLYSTLHYLIVDIRLMTPISFNTSVCSINSESMRSYGTLPTTVTIIIMLNYRHFRNQKFCAISIECMLIAVCVWVCALTCWPTQRRKTLIRRISHANLQLSCVSIWHRISDIANNKNKWTRESVYDYIKRFGHFACLSQHPSRRKAFHGSSGASANIQHKYSTREWF